MAERFEGIVVKDGVIKHGRERVSLAGAHLVVDSAGEIDKRITATRLILTGPFALAFRKKKDRRELYLMVEGRDGAFMIEVDPKKGADARKFATKVNALASRLAAVRTAPGPISAATTSTSSAPAAWLPDPGGKHELRYWDGTRWTDHVSNAGQQRLEPLGQPTANKVGAGPVAPPGDYMLEGSFDVEVRGESNYQDSFVAVFGPKRPEGFRDADDVVVNLVCETDNPYDKNAVKVLAEGKLLGYVAREAAAVLAPIIQQLERTNRRACCSAYLAGGWDRGHGDEGAFGISLRLPPPDQITL